MAHLVLVVASFAVLLSGVAVCAGAVKRVCWRESEFAVLLREVRADMALLRGDLSVMENSLAEATDALLVVTTMAANAERPRAIPRFLTSER